MPLEISGTFNFMLIFQAEHNILILMDLLHMLGVAGIFGGLLFSAIADAKGRVVLNWADIVNSADLRIEVMHERNAHNFTLDLAGTASLISIVVIK